MSYFENLVKKKVHDRIAKIITETAEKNKIDPTAVTYALKLDKGGRVQVIPHFNDKTHPIMSIDDFLE